MFIVNRSRQVNIAKLAKSIPALAWIVLFSALGIFSLYWLVVLKHHTYGGDYGIYFNAYTSARAGSNPYAPFAVGAGFVNHPIVMVLVRIMFFKDQHQSLVLWSGASVTARLISIGLTIYLALWQRVKEADDLTRVMVASILPGLLLVFGPFLEAITVGQVDTFALMFVLGSLLLSELDLPGLAGASIGTAILLKTSPVIFLAYFILTRQYRVVVFAAITILMLTVLSGIPFPGDVIGQFINILPKLSSAIHPTGYNLSLGSTAFRLWGDRTFWSASSVIPIANKVLLILTAGSLSLFAWRTDHKSRHRRMWLFACFQVLTVVFSPLVWYHHFTFLLFPLILFLRGPSSLVRGLGVISITLIQAERYFEAVSKEIPWPSLIALFVLLITAYVCYLFPPIPKEDSYRSGGHG